MYYNHYYAYVPHVQPYVTPYQVPYAPPQPPSFHRGYPVHAERQQTVRGQATWTEGGPVTKCNMAWSDNQYMTTAVGGTSPYKCGQALKVRNLNTGREIIVTVVDEVSGYPNNRLNLHRRAFEALGSNPDIGVMNIEITPSPDVEETQWGKYLVEVVQRAYPNYNVTDYQSVETTQVNAERTRETYEFTLQSPQETMTVRGSVTYNPNTNRVLSMSVQEV
ncbi:DUF3889 domain-containing protein [Salibacterium salarium]|uniref:DUF3889 domain-containing protein n=1 Tax=Salibacterium salarium TaxID=284579 RepID=A0A428NA30_9BACI|nr:DUF3889 domain-containing protein [Salibacterium salarium]RSL35247.1 DUF3889 domain-containing protein [Salibacterium salarium]